MFSKCKLKNFLVKGMRDITGDDLVYYKHLKCILIDIMDICFYQEIKLPILEKTDLFKVSIDNDTDMIQKEMYTFFDKDKATTSLTLRPEGTVSCLRAATMHDLIRNNRKQRLWYSGPMFRRENPQKGRYRQFYQLGAESFGFNSFNMEIEHILIFNRALKRLNLLGFVVLEINTLGNGYGINEYKVSLIKYLMNFSDYFNEKTIKKIKNNPLRILDSKDLIMQNILQNAPVLFDFLDIKSKDNFSGFCSALNQLNIKFKINNRLVRGLSYYNDIVYEWIGDGLGSQSTICAGGRYDSLVKKLTSGTSNFGVGFAVGLDRVSLLMKEKKIFIESDKITCYLFSSDSFMSGEIFYLGEIIRNVIRNIMLFISYDIESYNKAFSNAKKRNIRFLIIVKKKYKINNVIDVKDIKNNSLIEDINVLTIKERLMDIKRNDKQQ